MLPNSLHRILESKSQEFFHKNKGILIDIILFGSVVHGKKSPGDIDIILLFHHKKDLQCSYELRKIFERATGMKVDLVAKTYEELFEATFTAREAILSEGYSLIRRNLLSAGFGFKNMVLFTYALKGKTKSERMRFYYSLYGRSTKGMLHKLKAIKYTDTILLCPMQHRDEMHSYLQSWRLEFTEVPVLIPERVVL